MASSSSESSDDESNYSDSASQNNVIAPVPWVSRPGKRNFNIGPAANSFKNDGSFLEMFKKMQEKNLPNPTSEAGSSVDNKVSNSIKSEPDLDSKTSNSTSNDKINKTLNKFVGKRRQARVLPTGLVKKQRKEGDGEENSKESGKKPQKNDPWSKYMDEVRKYKQQSCSEEEGSRRPLVK